MQARIAKAAAPNLDWNAARLRNAQDPMTHFATENLGSALRDQDIPVDRQQTIRNFAIAHGVNPDLADHIANQAVGSNAVKHLTNVLRGEKIGEGRANTLAAMGLLRQSDPGNPTSPLHVTEDAQRLFPPGVQRFVQLKPEIARYTPSPDPSPGSALYQNAVAGMERFSKTAERMTPAPLPASEAKIVPSHGDTSTLLSAPPASALQPASESREAIAAEAARLSQQRASANGPDSDAPNRQDSPDLARESSRGMRRAKNRFVAGGIFPNGIKDDPIHFHHPYPMYLGGHFQQILEPLPKSLHQAYHRGLDTILPRKKGRAFYEAMTPDARNLMLRKLLTYTKTFDEENGTNLVDAMAREGFSNKP